MADARMPLLSHTQEGEKSYHDLAIPNFAELKETYAAKWNQEKLKFQNQLKCNFFAMVERQAEGKQEIFMLSAPERREKLYIQAFLDLFESQYTPHVGDIERLAGKRTRRLFITLPQSFY